MSNSDRPDEHQQRKMAIGDPSNAGSESDSRDAGGTPVEDDAGEELSGTTGFFRAVRQAMAQKPDDVELEPGCEEAMRRASLALTTEAAVDETIVGDVSADDGSGGSPSELTEIGPYELMGSIGAGGMGTVYRARHRKLNKIVALKILPATKLGKPEQVARFEREMRATGSLNHRNIVGATDAGVADGVHYLAMELIEGVDLAKLSAERGPLPVAVACELIRQVAVGLEHAHEKGQVHRDIKPSNLMLTLPDQSDQESQPTVKILDLGLASLDESQPPGEDLTTPGQILGTLDYMSPEQAQTDQTVGKSSDVYSLGATLFKLLTGKAPFAGTDPAPIKKLMAIATTDAPLLNTVRHDVDAKLVSFTARMLDCNSANRPTAREVAEFMGLHASINAVRELVQGAHIGTEDVEQLPTIVSTKPAATQPKLRRSSSWFGGRIVTGLAAATGFTVLIAWAIVITIRMADGTVEIRVADEFASEVQIELAGEGGPHRIDHRNWKIELNEGDYRVSLLGGSDRFELDRDSVRVIRGEIAVVTVSTKAPTGTEDRGSAPEISSAPAGETKSRLSLSEAFSSARPLEREDVIRIQTSARESALHGLLTSPVQKDGIFRWNIVPTNTLLGLIFGNDARSERSADGALLSWTYGECPCYTRILDVSSTRLNGIIAAKYSPLAGLTPDGHDQVVLRDNRNGNLTSFSVTGHETFRAEGEYTTGITVNADGTMVAAGFNGGALRIWKHTGEVLAEVEARDSWYKAISWCPKTDLVAAPAATGNAINIWRSTGSLVRTLDRHANHVDYVYWSPDGERLATADEKGVIILWDEDGQEVAELSEAKGKLSRVLWSPQARFLLSQESDGLCRVYRRDGGQMGSFNEPGRPTIRWSEDESLIGVENGLKVTFYDRDGTVVSRKEFLEDSPSSWYSTDFAFRDNSAGVLRDGFKFYDTARSDSGALSLPAVSPSPVIAWNFDGSQLAVWSKSSQNESAIQRIDPISGQVSATKSRLASLTSDIFWAKDLPLTCVDARTVFAISKNGSLAEDFTTGELKKPITAAWNNRGTQLAVGGYSGDAMILDAENDTLWHEAVFPSGTRSSEWNVDGTRVAFCSWASGEVVLVNAVTKELSRFLVYDGATATWSIAWHPVREWLVAGCNDRTARLWDLTDEQELVATLASPVGYPSVRDCQFTSDGQWIVGIVEGKEFDFVCVWPCPDSPRDAPVLPIRFIRTSSSIERMELSETNQIACSHLSGYVSVIDLATGDLNRSIVPFTNGETLVFDGQGELIAGNADMLPFMTWVVEQPGGQLTPLLKEEFDARIGLTPQQQAVQFLADVRAEVTLKDGGNFPHQRLSRNVDELPDAAEISEVDLRPYHWLNDEGLSRVAQLPSLAKLNIAGRQVTDEGIKAIRSCKALKELDLHDTQITGLCGRPLAQLPALERLDVSETQFSNVGLSGLLKSKSLRSLNLANSAVTANAIDDLIRMNSLTELILSEGVFTEEALSQLLEALPACKIEISATKK